MKLLIDVSLSPTWVPFLEQHDIICTHWSAVGRIDAPDRQIFDYVNDNDFVIFTHDLDFGTILAHTRSNRPSVIQLRVTDPLPTKLGTTIYEALARFNMELATGSLVTILPSKTRVRILPL